MTAPDDAVFALGRSYTNSKEYLSFVVLLGSVLKECQKHESIYDKGQEPGNEADIEEKQAVPEAFAAPAAAIQFLLPETLGAEADGQYARVIRSLMDRKGFAHHQLVTA